MTLLLSIITVHLLGLISPGPDFALVTRNSIIYSRKTGVYTAIGIMFGILVHMAYSLLGIGFLISQSVILFNAVKFLGAMYLIFIGYKSLRAKKLDLASTESTAPATVSPKKAMRMGFITNAMNVKATMYFLAIFSQFIGPQTPVAVQIVSVAFMILSTGVWFSLVAVLLSHKKVRARFARYNHYIEKTMGAILIALGLRVATSGK